MPEEIIDWFDYQDKMRSNLAEVDQLKNLDQLIPEAYEKMKELVEERLTFADIVKVELDKLHPVVRDMLNKF